MTCFNDTLIPASNKLKQRSFNVDVTLFHSFVCWIYYDCFQHGKINISKIGNMLNHITAVMCPQKRLRSVTATTFTWEGFVALVLGGLNTNFPCILNGGFGSVLFEQKLPRQTLSCFQRSRISARTSTLQRKWFYFWLVFLFQTSQIQKAAPSAIIRITYLYNIMPSFMSVGIAASDQTW